MLKKPSVITFPPLTFPFSGQNVAPGATSTNTETPIVYSSSNPAVATVTAYGELHIIGAGISVITANQTGNANYNPALPANAQLKVTTEQLIKFPGLGTKMVCDTDFPAGATSYTPLLPPSGIPISYTSSDPAVATVSAEGTIHILSPGQTTITATQDGTDIYFPAPPQSQILKVSLPQAPVVTITANKTVVCSGQPVTFTAIVTNIGQYDVLGYQWQVNGKNAGSSKTITIPMLSQTDMVKCTVTDYDQCQLSGSFIYIGTMVNTPVMPSIEIASSVTGPVCSGTPITFTAKITNGGANPVYQWLVNGSKAGTNGNTFTSANFVFNDQITCVVNNNDAPCSGNQSAVSNTLRANLVQPANPAPSITISASAGRIYTGTPVTFIAKPSNTGPDIDYQWQVNGKNTGENSAYFTSSTLAAGDKISCMLRLRNGCILTLISNTLIADVIPATLVISNTFTPNGDGVNDLWTIPGLINYPLCTVSVFNRFGTLVYQSKGYSVPWNGTYKGQLLSSGNYYYVITLSNKSPIISGSLSLIR